MLLLAGMTWISIALPFSPFVVAAFAVIAGLVLLRLAARLLEVLPG